MPKFVVHLFRKNTEWAQIPVEAENEDDAEKEALKLAKDKTGRKYIHWETDDNDAEEPEVNETLLED